MNRDWRDERIDQLVAENAALKAMVEKLLARVTELEEKLRKSSQNSSKPSSSDGPQVPPRPKKKASGRRPGGQPGHVRHERPQVPPEKVSKRVVLKPRRCNACGDHLAGVDASPRRHQVFELPKIEPIVTEYELHSLTCGCGVSTTAELPNGVPTGSFGPSVIAVVALLMGVYRLSKRAVPDLLQDLFGLSMSDGAVIGCQQKASAALEVPVVEAKKVIASAPVKNADETGWRQAAHRAWLWVVVTAEITVFMVHLRRNAVAARALLGNASGILGTDRHGAYGWWPSKRRQFCWAHLIRDFTAIAERRHASKRIGDPLLDEAHRMFAMWHRVREGTLMRSTFSVYMRDLRRRVEALLAVGAVCPHAKTARACKKILRSVESLWTFVHNEGVEPTNNAAERAVRHPVIWRKACYGTHSEAGSRFVERILTTHATLRQQGRNVLEFIHAACVAKLQGITPPSLLPSSKQPVLVKAKLAA